MRTPNTLEKRRAPRIGVPVYVQAFSESFPLGFLKNISSEGMFVQSTEPKEVGTRMDLSFRPDESSPDIQVTAEVIWVNYPPSFAEDENRTAYSRGSVTDNPGMGLRIISIAPNSEPLLDSFIRNTETAAAT